MSGRFAVRLVPLFLMGLMVAGIWMPSGALPTPPIPDALGVAPAIGFEPVAAGLSGPVYVTHAGDGSGRLFIVEQRGTVRLIEDGALVPSFYLDIRDRVLTGGERGLLSIAFDPGFSENGRLYASYTAPGGQGVSVLSRFTVPDSASGIPDLASEEILLTVQQPFSNHNGGLIKFGPDGHLYLGLGDGGSSGDPQNHGQNRNTLLGALLRLDVSGTEGYEVPVDNPFVGGEGRDEIWAYGLRNPWRWSFDRQTGDLWLGDVGQNMYEEVNFVAAGSAGGQNYGWRALEAFYPFSPAQLADVVSPELVVPIYSYGISGTADCAVTGGYVYRGNAIPDLVGRYVFADFCSGRMLTLAAPAPAAYELPSPGSLISSFGEDEAGELYITRLTGQVDLVVAP